MSNRLPDPNLPFDKSVIPLMFKVFKTHTINFFFKDAYNSEFKKVYELRQSIDNKLSKDSITTLLTDF
jgi:anthranilate phosphoribosyltransferase